MPTQEEISTVMRTLGSRKTPAKAASSARNLAVARAARRKKTAVARYLAAPETATAPATEKATLFAPVLLTRMDGK